MDLSRCTLALLNEDQSSYRVLTLLETRQAMPWTTKQNLPLDSGIHGDVILNGEPRIYGDLSGESAKGVPAADPCIEGGSLSSIMCLPLQVSARTFGSIAFGTNQKVGYTREDMYGASTIATHLSLAIDRWNIGLDNIRLTKALEQRFRELERIYHNTPVMMHSIDGDGRLINVNDFWLRTLGYERDELVGKRSVDFLTEESRRRAVEVDIPRLFKTGVAKDGEYQMVKKNGEVIDVLLSAVLERDEEGKIVRSFAFIVDVTHRKKAEEALRQSEARFRRLVEHAADAFYLVDPETSRILDVNERASQALGYTRDELLNMTVQDMSVHVTQEQLKRIYDKCVSGVPHTWEATHRRKDGSTFPAEVRVLAFEEAEQKLQVALARDITDRKRAEEALKERTAELEAFSYSISHDLRAPLLAIDGFSQILAADYVDKLDAEGLRLLSVIRQNTKAMGQMINDMLAFFRLGRQEMQPTEVDLSDLARSIAEELRCSNAERKLQFKIQPLPRVRGDDAMMRQALVNLLSNAVKFTIPRDVAVIEVGHRSEAGRSIYYVKDNGVGFDMQYVDKIFGVFQRLHTVDEFEGTGVGLAIVQRIFHRHGGEVWAEGKIDEGAVISFTVPRPEARRL